MSMLSGKNIALGGLLSALTIVILYLTLLIPTNTLTFLTLASFMVPIALIRGNLKTALAVYISSSILCLLLVPSLSIPYIIFFGCYGIIKYFIEGLDRYVLEWVLKFTFFNIIYFIILQSATLLFGPHYMEGLQSLADKLIPQFSNGAIILLWLIAQFAFAIFDYALTLLIDSYYKYFNRH